VSRTLTSTVSILLLLVLISAGASTARAYVLTGGKWPQPGACGSDCPGSPVTITYSYQNMFDGALKMPNGDPLPAPLIRGSIEEAFHLWSSVAPLNFVEVPDDGLSYGPSTQYGQLRFRHVFINGPDPPPPADPIAKAQAYFPAGPEYSGDVEFDHSDPWQEVGTLSSPDILGAAIHEIGHTLGLNHTDVVGANLYWIFHRFGGLGTGQLFPDDIAGIQAIYGSGVGSVSPLAVPEPATTLLAALGAACLLTNRRTRR
jgi:hypothetical protein